MFKFELRQQVSDTVTGMVGTVTGRADYLQGSALMRVTTSASINNNPKEWWIEQDRLRITAESE